MLDGERKEREGRKRGGRNNRVWSGEKKKERKKNEKRDSVKRNENGVYERENEMDRQEKRGRKRGGKEGVPLGGKRLDTKERIRMMG